jgi:fused signal recognition particle receptor
MVIVGIAHELKIGVRFVGIGEKLNDLAPFSQTEFIESIL